MQTNGDGMKQEKAKKVLISIGWQMLLSVVLSSMIILDVSAHPPLILLNQQMLQLQSQLQQARAECLHATKVIQPLGIVGYSLQAVHSEFLPKNMQHAACQQTTRLTKKLQALTQLYFLWQAQTQRQTNLSTQ